MAKREFSILVRNLATTFPFFNVLCFNIDLQDSSDNKVNNLINGKIASNQVSTRGKRGL